MIKSSLELYIYGILIEEPLDGDSVSWPRYALQWWKNISKIDYYEGVSWFNLEVSRRVYNGINSSFWRSKWRGGMSFCSKYPRLFAISTQKDAKIAELWRDNGGQADWNFT
jgi:hypothetical protein